MVDSLDRVFQLVAVTVFLRDRSFLPIYPCMQQICCLLMVTGIFCYLIVFQYRSRGSDWRLDSIFSVGYLYFHAWTLIIHDIEQLTFYTLACIFIWLLNLKYATCTCNNQHATTITEEHLNHTAKTHPETPSVSDLHTRALRIVANILINRIRDISVVSEL